MRLISGDEYDQIRLLTLAGASVRTIKEKTGRATNTVIHYRNFVLSGNEVLCGCGRDIKHQGWCKFRMARHPKRRDFMTRWSRHRKIDWCWKVLRRISRGRFITKKVLMQCLVRLANKHSSRPEITVERLSTLLWFEHSVLGIFDGDVITQRWQIAERELTHVNYCPIPTRVMCSICGKPAYCESKDNYLHHCNAEWCKRIYTFYYVEGRNRPSTVRGGKKNGLRFEYFLSDYIRRFANDKQNIGA